MDKARKAGVYAASADWDKLFYLAIAAVAAWEYVAPWVSGLVLPALVKHAYQARVIGLRVLLSAYYQVFQGASEEKAERWAEEEAKQEGEGK